LSKRNRFTCAVENLASEFGLPIEVLLRAELRPLFVNRIALAVACEILTRRPILCGAESELHHVFRLVAETLGWDAKELFRQAYQLGILQQATVGLTARLVGTSEAAKASGLSKRIVKSMADKFEWDSSGESDLAGKLREVEAEVTRAKG